MNRVGENSHTFYINIFYINNAFFYSCTKLLTNLNHRIKWDQKYASRVIVWRSKPQWNNYMTLDTLLRGFRPIFFLSKYVEYFVKIHQIKQKRVGQTKFVWAVENGAFLALLTHIGVFRSNLDVVKPFKCFNVYLKSKGNFRATFRNFCAISLRFRIDGGKHVIPTSSPSFYPISLKNW